MPLQNLRSSGLYYAETPTTLTDQVQTVSKYTFRLLASDTGDIP